MDRNVVHARTFVVRLRQLSRQPKTVDAYARNLDAYLAYFATAPDERARLTDRVTAASGANGASARAVSARPRRWRR